MGTVIINHELEEKFKQAIDNGRIVMFSAPCGFGKSTTAKTLLEGYKTKTLYADDENFEVPIADDENWDVLIIERFQFLQDLKQQQDLCELMRKSNNKKFIILSRGVVPGWLAPFQLSGLMTVFKARDLLFDIPTIAKIFEKYNVSISKTDISELYKQSYGYPVAISYVVKRMSLGEKYDLAMDCAVRQDVYMYFEDAVFNRFDISIRRFLLELAPFEFFGPELAKMVSGDKNAGEILDFLQKNTTMMLYENVNKARFWPQFRNFLMWKAERTYTTEQLQTLYNRGGLYYELHDDYARALECYSKSGDHKIISEILTKNSKLNQGIGRYTDVEKYYRALPEKEILESPSLMRGMCMLSALCNDYAESEKWYRALCDFAEGKKSTDAAAKEAKSHIVWLDIALPQRDVNAIIENIINTYKMICSKHIKVPSFSVTNMMPSVINGDKDFSEWCKIDDELYKKIKIPLETVVGKDGMGLTECGLAESKYEKGEDISSKMLSLVARLNEIYQHGTPDIFFAIVGLLARTQVDCGKSNDAVRTLESLKERFAEKENLRFIPNIDAMICRAALRNGDIHYAEIWYRDKAPREHIKFQTMKRYQYFTQAMVEIAMGNYSLAMITLAPFERYCEVCKRHIDKINLNIMKSIIKYRTDDNSWKKDFITSLDIAYDYKFIRPISLYGAAVLPMFEKSGWDKDKEYLNKLINYSRMQAVYYPNFLRIEKSLVETLTTAEMQVLRLLCADKSNAEIGEILDIKLATVKSHVSHILQKLGVKKRSEAKTVASKFKLF